jgi:hypothetical protein
LMLGGAVLTPFVQAPSAGNSRQMYLRIEGSPLKPGEAYET